MIERMVLFGASGDLTSRLLLPAIAQLAADDLLAPGLTIVGSDIADWSTGEFREHIAGKLQEHATVPSATRDRVVSMLTFEPADVTRPEDVGRVIGDDHPNTLVYLALPPSLLTTALPALAETRLGSADAVAIEKPFGTD
ncbi:MAG: glucose-6-phosphate dehydrogenase, partial [Solirubrobacteraceae bacterium]